ncbi:MAG: DNA polymerase ligase N-terminal domain-containing protein [Thermoproteota archaeon]
MPSSNSLKKYREKRDFRKTPEPRQKEEKTGNKRRFVFHKHDASNLHYDFRLEVEDVLKSWAVPKGPSTDPNDKRLALPTEDHPLDYIDFEGVIPEGEYGAGTVMVWDTRTYQNRNKEDDEIISMKQAIEDGHVKFWLKGEKIKGGYALVRTKKGEDERWLLIKMDDGEADARRNPVSTEPQSVLSGRSLEEIAKQEKNDKK